MRLAGAQPVFPVLLELGDIALDMASACPCAKSLPKVLSAIEGNLSRGPRPPDWTSL